MPRTTPLSNSLVLFWCLALFALWPHAVHAQEALKLQAESSLARDLRGYDLESLAWAVVMSLMGGGLRTIYTLATDSTVVLSFGREMLKDSVVAMIAGALAYILLEAAAAAKWLPVPAELRLAAIVFAGWTRLSFFGWLNTLGTKITEAIEAKVQSSIGNAEVTGPGPGMDARFDQPGTPGPNTPNKPKPFNEVQP